METQRQPTLSQIIQSTIAEANGLPNFEDIQKITSLDDLIDLKNTYVRIMLQCDSLMQRSSLNLKLSSSPTDPSAVSGDILNQLEFLQALKLQRLMQTYVSAVTHRKGIVKRRGTTREAGQQS